MQIIFCPYTIVTALEWKMANGFPKLSESDLNDISDLAEHKGRAPDCND